MLRARHGEPALVLIELVGSHGVVQEAPPPRGFRLARRNKGRAGATGPWCCSDHDCRELEEDKGETVLEEPGRLAPRGGRVAARGSRAAPSPDGKYHLCEEATTKLPVHRFFAPPGST